MKRSDLNHLRRLVAWARCEIGQPPGEHAATVQHLAERSVPKYVRDAVKALDRYARPPGAVIRLFRAKQRGGKRKAERIDMSPDVTALTERLIALPRPDGCLHVFTSRDGNPYTEAAFTTLWQRIMTKAMEDKVIERRFTFHDLRAYYTTQHKDRYGGLPDIHANPATTSKVYDRSKVAKRRGL